MGKTYRHIFFFKLLIYLYIFGSAGSLLLCGTFFSRAEQGLLFVLVHGLLIVVASPVAEHRL